MGFLSNALEKQASFASIGRLLNKGRKLALKAGPVDAASLNKFDDVLRSVKNKGYGSSWAAKNVPGDVRRLNMTQQANMLTDILGPDAAYDTFHAALRATGGDSVKALRLLRKGLKKGIRNRVTDLAQNTVPKMLPAPASAQKLLPAPASAQKLLPAPASAQNMLPATVSAPKAGLVKADDVIDVATTSPGGRTMRTANGRVISEPADAAKPVTAPKAGKPKADAVADATQPVNAPKAGKKAPATADDAQIYSGTQYSDSPGFVFKEQPKAGPAAPEAPVKAPTQSSAAAAADAAEEATAGMRNYSGGATEAPVDVDDINKMLVGDAAEMSIPFSLARWAHENPGMAWLTAGLGTTGLLGVGGAVGHRIGQDAYYD
jgi:hypothetical protein